MTAPLVHADCDLRDFAFMPLDVVRLRDSDLAASSSGEDFRCAVMLWCASWHQIPAASLPDDDVVLCQLAGFGRVVKAWQKQRNGALRGWVKCDDGRLYHPVIAEKANDAWQAKLKQRHSTECARIKKHNQRHDVNLNVPDFQEWLSLGCPQGQSLLVPNDKLPQSQYCPSGNPLQEKGIVKGTGTVINLKASEPNGSGGEPPVGKQKITDPSEIIFGFGVTLLVSAGSTDKHARSFLGSLRKSHGDKALIDKLRECALAKPLQPVEWLAAALPPKGNGRPHVGFDKVNYNEGVAADGSF